MKVTTTFTTRAAPTKVWSVISDLYAYADWHPDYAFKGKQDYSALRIVWKVRDRWRPSFPVQAIGSMKPNFAGFSMGVQKFFMVKETYEIAATSNGSVVDHSMNLTGLVGEMAGRIARNEIRNLLDQRDISLMRRLRRWSRV